MKNGILVTSLILGFSLLGGSVGAVTTNNYKKAEIKDLTTQVEQVKKDNEDLTAKNESLSTSNEELSKKAQDYADRIEELENGQSKSELEQFAEEKNAMFANISYVYPDGTPYTTNFMLIDEDSFKYYLQKDYLYGQAGQLGLVADLYIKGASLTPDGEFIDNVNFVPGGFINLYLHLRDSYKFISVNIATTEGVKSEAYLVSNGEVVNYTEPTLEGYTFKGWATIDPIGTDTPDADIFNSLVDINSATNSIPDGSTICLYAVFTDNNDDSIIYRG